MSNDMGAPPPAPAGWYPDPTTRHQYRYFDGARWSEHVANEGLPSVDPIGPPPPHVARGAIYSAAAAETRSGTGATGWQQPSAQPWQPPVRGLKASGGVTGGQAIRRCLSKYADFSGRAPRSEYWWFLLAFLLAIWLAYAVGFFIAVTVDPGVGAAIMGLVWLALLLPILAVTARRLHDVDRSGWLQLIAAVPLVGPILMIVWTTTEGSTHANQYGPPVSR